MIEIKELFFLHWKTFSLKSYPVEYQRELNKKSVRTTTFILSSFVFKFKRLTAIPFILKKN